MGLEVFYYKKCFKFSDRFRLPHFPLLTFPDFSCSERSLSLETDVDLEEKLINSNSVILKSTVVASGGIGAVIDIESFNNLEKL